MKLTLINVKRIKRESESTLEKYVCDYIISKWGGYSDKKSVFTDVLYHGCQSGIVSSLVWYSDTVAFYNRNRDEINELLYNIMEKIGTYDPLELFGDKWDKEDPLALEDFNRNLLAWFAFEETLRSVGYKFESLQEYI